MDNPLCLKPQFSFVPLTSMSWCLPLGDISRYIVGQTKYYKIGVSFFSAKHTAFKEYKSKH